MSKELINSDSLQKCAKLYVSVFNQPPWDESWTEEQAMTRLRFYYDTPNFIGISISTEDKLLGFVLGNYEPYQNESLFLLKEMCVQPQYQGKGIGTELINLLHKELKSRRILTVNLITQVNGEAESFYLKNCYYKTQKMGLYVARFKT